MNEPSQSTHVPVMPAEVLELLDPQPGQIVVDATVGAAGHSRLIVERLGSEGHLIGLDQDPAALQNAERRLAGLPVTLVHANFEDLSEVLQKLQRGPVDAVM